MSVRCMYSEAGGGGGGDMWAWVNVYACVCESVSARVLGVPPHSPGNRPVNMDVKSIK